MPTGDKEALEADLRATLARMTAEAETREKHHAKVVDRMNRLKLRIKWVVAAGMVTVGALMCLFGAAHSVESEVGWWARYVFGGYGVIAGLVLAKSLCNTPRSLAGEAAALVSGAVWTVAMLGSFATPMLLHDRSARLAPWGEVLAREAGRPYVIGVYATLLAIVLALAAYVIKVYLEADDYELAAIGATRSPHRGQ